MPTILDEIVARKEQEIRDARRRRPLAELEAALDSAPPLRDFLVPLAAPGPIKLIAEVKKASPSAGVIRADFDPIQIAQAYERHGASCLSVLTDGPYFQGDLAHLASVRAAVHLPLLRKDFILDPYQVFEARTAGADAVLLIAEILDDCRLGSLLPLIEKLGMHALVEIYEPENLSRALDRGARLVGINNRNLRTFETNLGHTLRLADQVPDDCVLVSESGIRTRQDVLALQSAGVDAILVGETLMRATAIGPKIDELLGRPSAIES